MLIQVSTHKWITGFWWWWWRFWANRCVLTLLRATQCRNQNDDVNDDRQGAFMQLALPLLRVPSIEARASDYRNLIWQICNHSAPSAQNGNTFIRHSLEQWGWNGCANECARNPIPISKSQRSNSWTFSMTFSPHIVRIVIESLAFASKNSPKKQKMTMSKRKRRRKNYTLPILHYPFVSTRHIQMLRLTHTIHQRWQLFGENERNDKKPKISLYFSYRKHFFRTHSNETNIERKLLTAVMMISKFGHIYQNSRQSNIIWRAENEA